MNKQYYEKIDILKGIAIILVIVGHIIQYTAFDSYDFFENKIFIFIYSFHMPLFMIISGYLFYNTVVNKDVLTIIKSRLKSLLYPLIIFTIIGYYVNELLNLIINHNFYGFYYSNWLGQLGGYWFIWSIIASISVILISNTLSKNKLKRVILYLVLFPLVIIFPNPDLNLFMYGYFLLGYLFNQYKNQIPNILLKLKYFILIYPAFLIFWNKQNYIYLTGMINIESINSFKNQIFIDLIRFLYGLFGCIFIIVIVDIIFKCKNKLLQKVKNIIIIMGKNSLQIYLIQRIIIEILYVNIYNIICTKIGKNIFYISNKYLYYLLIIPIISILILVLINIIINLLEKKKISKYIFGR